MTEKTDFKTFNEFYAYWPKEVPPRVTKAYLRDRDNAFRAWKQTPEFRAQRGRQVDTSLLLDMISDARLTVEVSIYRVVPSGGVEYAVVIPLYAAVRPSDASSDLGSVVQMWSDDTGHRCLIAQDLDMDLGDYAYLAARYSPPKR